MQLSGIKVLGMLGGAAKGTYARLDQDDANFEIYYKPLKGFIEEKEFDGLDLDVEEEMSLSGIIRLIDRLKADFGEDFLITMAPVATALLSDEPKYNLSGFSYEALEVMKGNQIAWYNTQFYCGWGDISNTDTFDQIIAHGYPANKITIGLVTNPENGSGWIPHNILQEILLNLTTRYPNLCGIMGWEYFNSLPGGTERPWEWAANMTRYIRNGQSQNPTQRHKLLGFSALWALADFNIKQSEGEAPKPDAFDYFSENEEV
ncbi:putative glycoside hydrolase family 18 protein [Erysiphe necator]|uniref:Putative glycoside hydrolase family 18 protein n=1 Tax=Uncinula necator TaxID=52586 RepID=A0A0B1P0H6_UNCNE|nr:putative glycoside hydrolase family 18 protein [Erysiphe necator]